MLVGIVREREWEITVLVGTVKEGDRENSVSGYS